MEVPLDLDSICWVCFKRNGNMTDVSWWKTVDTPFYHVLRYLLSEECLKERVIKLMCEKCVTDARLTYIFKQKCEKSWEFIFSNTLSQQTKSEDKLVIEDETDDDHCIEKMKLIPDRSDENTQNNLVCRAGEEKEPPNAVTLYDIEAELTPITLPVERKRSTDDDVVCIDDDDVVTNAIIPGTNSGIKTAVSKKPSKQIPQAVVLVSKKISRDRLSAECSICGKVNVYFGAPPRRCRNCRTAFVIIDPMAPIKLPTPVPQQKRPLRSQQQKQQHVENSVTKYKCATCKLKFASLREVRTHVYKFRNGSCTEAVTPTEPSALENLLTPETWQAGLQEPVQWAYVESGGQKSIVQMPGLAVYQASYPSNEKEVKL